MLKISIIIPVSRNEPYLEECLKHCRGLDYPNYEIILLPDAPLDIDMTGIREIPTGTADPCVKRNIGIKNALGEICAFIDSDAYPEKDWLTKAVMYFNWPEVVAVGGPNMTPDDDTPMQQANGIILSSFLGGRRYTTKYSNTTNLVTSELQTVNMFVRKETLEALGGFQEGLWPGEDAKLSFQITDIIRKKQLYVPDLLVYHHRRPLFKPYLSQVWRSGITKGALIKQFFSLKRYEYWLPSLFIIGVVIGLFLAFLHPILAVIYLFVLGAYLLAAVYISIKTANFKLGTAVFTGIILTHFTYGISFLTGLFRRNQV